MYFGLDKLGALILMPYYRFPASLQKSKTAA